VYEYPIFTNHSAFERGTHAYSARLYAKGLCPSAEAILATCVILSINEAYTDTDLEETAHAIRRVVQWFRSKNQS
jgi:dTDP-4-amino-4,6-dideoxygalactose transaminase